MELITNIKSFVGKFHQSQYLITCRIAATPYTFEHFTYMEIADFAPAQVLTFANKWFGGDDEKRHAFVEEMGRPEHRSLQQLARTPLLLTLLCLAFEELLYLPKRHAEIYQEALEALLQQWDDTRGVKRDTIYGGLSLIQKLEMLAYTSSR